MDQTINQILALDAETEERLQMSKTLCAQIIDDAHKKAAAIEQAQTHQTRDLIGEFEEQTRAAYEEKLAKLRAETDSTLESIREYFEARQDALLEALFQDTLRAAEE